MSCQPNRMRVLALPLLLLLLSQVALAHPLLGGFAAGLASGIASGAAHAGAESLSKSVVADIAQTVPTYPTATDYASGVCAGYAFCFANWNPPVLTEPDVVCPTGYEVTQQYGKPFCVQKLGLCPPSYDLSSSGQCCTVKTKSLCFPSWDSCSAAGGSFTEEDVGSICKGSPEYTTLVNHIDMVDVTQKSFFQDTPMTTNTLPSTPTLSGKGGSSSSSSGYSGYSSSGYSGYSTIGGSSGYSTIGGSSGYSMVGNGGFGSSSGSTNVGVGAGVGGIGGMGGVGTSVGVGAGSSSGINVGVGVGVNAGGGIGRQQQQQQQSLGPDVILGSSNNPVPAGAAVDVLPPGAIAINGPGSSSSSNLPGQMVGGGSSSSSEGIPGLPPGSIIIDDPSAATGADNLPVITIQEPQSSTPGAPAPVVIDIDSNGNAKVNNGGAAGQGAGVTPGGNNMAYSVRPGGSYNGQMTQTGMTNPTVIPPGSLVNVNGQLVRVGGGSPSSAAGGSSSAWQQQQQQPEGLVNGGYYDDSSLADAQTIPAGSFVDMGGGKVVQVGRPPAPTSAVAGAGAAAGAGLGGGAVGAAGGGSNMNMNVNIGTGAAVTPPTPTLTPPVGRPMTPQQQQALQALQNQADTAGSYIWMPQTGINPAAPAAANTAPLTPTGGSGGGLAGPGAGAGIVRPAAGGFAGGAGGDAAAAAAGGAANGVDDGGSGIAPDEIEDTAAAAAAAPAAAAGGASPSLGATGGGQGGGVLEDEWEQPSTDQQESGRISLPESVPIFDEITYETSSGKAWKPQQQQQQPKKQQQHKKLLPQYASQGSSKPQQQHKKKQQQQQPVTAQTMQQRLTYSNMRVGGIDPETSSWSPAEDDPIFDAADSSSSSSSSSGGGGGSGRNSSSSSSSVGVAAVGPAALLPPPPGKVLKQMLLLLPKMPLGLLERAGKLALSRIGGKAATELLAAREVLASLHTHKEDLLPKCFQKCCTQDADVVCLPSKQTINYAKPQLMCPDGCSLNTALGKCVCRPGSYSPCLPTDTVCSWGDQPICVGSTDFFGVPACTFVGALQQHLPRVQCPY